MEEQERDFLLLMASFGLSSRIKKKLALKKISLKLFSHSERSLMKAAQLVSGLLVWQRVHRINNGILRILVFACFNLWLKRMHDLHGDT